MTPTSHYSTAAIYSLFLKNPVAPLANAVSCRSRIVPCFYAVNTASDAGRVRSFDVYGPELIKKHQESKDDEGSGTCIGGVNVEEDEVVVEEEEEEEVETELVDWEDQILADTVPLVGLVRMILHSGKYKSGDRLSPEHERTIVERLLPHHPGHETKIGCGVDYIMLGYHPEFRSSRCLFIVRKDGELVDFSYWKCIKGLIRKKYPLYADTFILRHFRQRQRNA